MQSKIITQSSLGPKRYGLLLSSWTMIPFLFCNISKSFLSLEFYSVSWLSFWFIIVLLLDLRIDKSLMRFLSAPICSSRSFAASAFLFSSFSSYLFLSTNFFLMFYSSLSLSERFCIWTWCFVIFSPFRSRFSLVCDSNSCFSLSHSLFLSSKLSLIYSYCLVFSSNYSSISSFSSFKFCRFFCKTLWFYLSSFISVLHACNWLLYWFFWYYFYYSDLWSASLIFWISSLSWSFSIRP